MNPSSGQRLPQTTQHAMACCEKRPTFFCQRLPGAAMKHGEHGNTRLRIGER